MSGFVIGVREWPRPGLITEQLGVHVEAIDLLASELNAILSAPKAGEAKTEPEPTAP